MNIEGMYGVRRATEYYYTFSCLEIIHFDALKG